MGGGMIPFLVRQGGVERGWGRNGIWMNNVAQSFSLLVGPDAINVPPPRTQVLTVGFQHDALADNRIGNEVFEAITVEPAQKRHVIMNTDVHGQPIFQADHLSPNAMDGGSDAVDFLLWRYLDLLETCALTGHSCQADHATVGSWSDGTPIVNATVSDHPVDVGPYPALLAECDGVFGQQVNDERIHRCGATRL